ncbi:NACHT and WD repeat domain-containing protein 2-like [Cololabis saira]|uniref:NACHT and WD repeat domain-containing protein 2-like n=1 Tax=Cololabis saira TaxID=129043 RepID=UPI002AD51284|nr:NACHT and WD repeat domain-containing protein 2-like [Cololabis saira]
MNTEEDCLPSNSSCSSSCVKIYLCSNPEDSVVERRALRESVFPRFRENCRRSHRLDVRVIDPYESNDPSCWPDEISRQQLIEECRESSAGPFLLALVGHQYGTASLPPRVEVSEFQLLLQVMQQAGSSTQDLEQSYLRDENAVPASYCLKPPLTHTCSPLLANVKEEEESNRKNTEELVKVFQSAASLCVQNGLMSPERVHSFYTSALDADIRFALGNRPGRDIVNRSVVYVHKVLNAKADTKERLNLQLPSESETRILDSSKSSEAPAHGELLSELCDNFLPGLITTCQLLVYTTTTECDQRHGYTSARRRGYADSLCEQVYSDLLLLTDSWNISAPRGDAHMCDALYRERAEQEQLREVLSRFYDVTQPEEEKIRAYVEQNEHRRPLVVTGGPCTGKTVLIAHCTQQLKFWLTDGDPVVMSYWCNLSINTSPKHLLSSLCRQVACRYNHQSCLKQAPDFYPVNDPVNPGCSTNSREYISNCSLTSLSDFVNEHNTTEHLSDSKLNIFNIPHSYPEADVCLFELEEHLASLLSLLPSPKKPLVLIFDGLDQMKNNFGLQIIRSLPSPLPPNVKLILTVSSNRTRLLQAIRQHYSQGRLPQRVLEGSKTESGHVRVELGSMDRKQCVQMLASLLKSSGRRVTSGQQALVNQALTSCGLPLYTRLLHAHTSLWHSDSDVTESSLPDGVHSSISALLDHLEQKHGSWFVARAVSYLTLSRTGLSEAELADMLSNADDILAEYVCHAKGPICTMKVPQVNVERLLLDLKSFLIKRTFSDWHLLFWVSRHFKLVVAKKYLGTQEAKKKTHSEMADYFSGQLTPESGKPPRPHHSPRPNSNAGSRAFLSCSSKDVGCMNVRQIVDLLHHLQQSDRPEEFERLLLMSSGFHQALVQAGLLGELVSMLETNGDSSTFQFLRERLLLASTLKCSSCFLVSSPLELPTVMENGLLPFVEVFPTLDGYIRDIRERRRKRGKGLGVDLCPSPLSATPIQCLKSGNKTRDICVTESAVAGCSVVAEVMEDGSVWVWKGFGCDLVKLSLSLEQEELKFTGVKSSDQFLLLSTRVNKLFVWDVMGPERFLEVEDSLQTEFESGQTPNRVEGFVACQKKLGMWWKNESFVSVYDISRENWTRFHCQSAVTSLVFSFDGLWIYCGQEGGLVSMFDITTRSLVGTCSNSNHAAVLLMILCEDEQEMACVDATGNIAFWDVGDKTQPTLFEENFNQDNSKNILNTDFLDEVDTLLVCQAHQVTVWDTCNWEQWGRFLAPQDRAFAQAVLVQEGHLILALLHSSSLVLVWRISTGECVLSLETNKQPHTLLKTASNVICVTQDGSLTVWDSGMIDAAGTAPKMGCGVKDVVIEQSGKRFYTRDGSEKVWMWNLGTGLPQASFLHDGPVEKLQLSPNSIHLVSLSAGDIYVWRTETGENIVRISGSGAADVLITPNSNFGVSISRKGLSRVWKIARGSIVCSIHVCLSSAQVSPESTFLIGLRGGDLLAASLWTGLISKRFSCVEHSEHVVSFHTLKEHPDFVVVMVASGSLYTWKVAEETVCQHFQLPHMFHCQPKDFQMSSNGSYALLSTSNGSIDLLDLSGVRLLSFKVKGLVVEACLDKTGRYLAYMYHPTGLNNSCTCDLHTKPVLAVTRLSDGDRIGSVHLSKNPSSMVICDRRIFVGFEDGSVGIYSVLDGMINEEELISDYRKGQQKRCPFDVTPFSWFPLENPNITWP